VDNTKLKRIHILSSQETKMVVPYLQYNKYNNYNKYYKDYQFYIQGVNAEFS